MTRSVLLALALVSSVALHAQDFQEGTWGGTLSRLGNRAQQRQKFALEFKKVPNPHWAWRPGTGDTWNVTVIVQQGRSQAMDFRHDNDAMSFSFRRQDSLVTCQLTRQADATYEGDCVSAGDATRFRASLTPPKSPAK